MAKTEYYYAVGRRKEACATVRLTRGKGQILVNSKPAEEYFAHSNQTDALLEPLKLLQKETSFDVSLHTKGGGLNGQAEAARLAIAKALVESNPDVRTTLKKAGLLKRDDREKERKKYGLKRARKAPQFTKR